MGAGLVVDCFVGIYFTWVDCFVGIYFLLN